MAITLKDAAARIRAGELVAFPTETVYGLGANALDAAAVRKIYAAKNRPATSPLIVHIASVDMASTILAEWPPEAEALAQAYWPGPLTLVLPKRTEPKNASIPDIVTAGLPTVGVRMPDHPLALSLIREAAVPIAAPSANRFTGLSPTTAEHVREIFGDTIPILDGGPCRVGIESTVVSIVAGKITLLRPGHVSLNAIAEIMGRPVVEIVAAAVPTKGSAHAAPGMHERHYSPRTPLVLTREPDPRGAYLYYTDDYTDDHTDDRTPGRRHAAMAARAVQMPEDPEAYAAHLYGALHELDRAGLPVISVEPLPETSEWDAVRDRLRRAASK